MIKVTINGKNIELSTPTPLKELVTDLAFPCKGKGICGRCKITAQNIPPTNKDYKFFTKEQLEQGTRIACDKIIEQDCSITYAPSDNVIKREKIEHCSMFAYLGIHKMVIGILDDDSLKEIAEYTYEYSLADKGVGKRLKASLIEHSLELMEAYSVPQALSLLIGGNAEAVTAFLDADFINRSQLDSRDTAFASYSTSGVEYHLPAEDIFILPFINGYLGSDIIGALANMDKNTLLIKASPVPTFATLEGDNYTVAPFYPSTSTTVPNAAYLASIQYFLALNPNIDKVLSSKELRLPLPESLQALDLEEKIVEFFALAATTRKYRTLADKIRHRSNIIDLSLEGLWQDFFTSASKE